MNSFKDREKSSEKKFAHDEETLFKINARRNKYLGEWASQKLNKNDKDQELYIQEVIKSDFSEPGDEDVFRKIKDDLAKAGFKNIDDEERIKLGSTVGDYFDEVGVNRPVRFSAYRRGSAFIRVAS